MGDGKRPFLPKPDRFITVNLRPRRFPKRSAFLWSFASKPAGSALKLTLMLTGFFAVFSQAQYLVKICQVSENEVLFI